MKLLGVGELQFNPKVDLAELAAWTSVDSTILNYE